MKTHLLIAIATPCLLLAGCGPSKELTKSKAQYAFEKIPDGGRVIFTGVRKQNPDGTTIVETSFKDFPFTHEGVAGKYNGVGSALFMKQENGPWKLKGIHINEPSVTFNYDSAAE